MIAVILECIGTCETDSDIWAEAVYTLLVTSDEVHKVEHEISMDIPHVEFLPVKRMMICAIALISLIIFKEFLGQVICIDQVTIVIKGACNKVSSTITFSTAVRDTETDRRCEPLSDIYIHCRSKSVEEFQLAVMLTEILVDTTTDSDKPVCLKAADFHTTVVDNFLLNCLFCTFSDSCLLCHHDTHSSKEMSYRGDKIGKSFHFIIDLVVIYAFYV